MRSLNLYITLSILIFWTSIVYSQVNKGSYKPDNLANVENYLEKINSDFIDKIDGDHSPKIKKVFKNRDEKVIKAIRDSTYYFNATLQTNLNTILENIYEANPTIDHQDYSFFIKNSIIPNAACFGDGMFEVNLGLFTTLIYDDEIAFVLCHEIAHKLLEHSLKKVTRHVSTLNSKETKKRVRKLKRQKYGQTRAALSVIDEFSIDILDFSKEIEAEADSLGYVLFSNTNYNLSNAVSSLEKIKLEDGDMLFAFDVKIDSVFNFDSYPFKEYWLEKETSLFVVSEKIDEFKLSSDTLETHPEIDYRMRKLQENKVLKKSMQASSNLNMLEISKIAEIQSIEYTIDLNYLDLAIYQLITKFKKQKITKDYYYFKMVELLQQIYIAKDNHELGKYVPTVSTFSDEIILNEIRLFLHNIELSEIAKLSRSFCEANKDKLSSRRKEFTSIHNYFNNLN